MKHLFFCWQGGESMSGFNKTHFFCESFWEGLLFYMPDPLEASSLNLNPKDDLRISLSCAHVHKNTIKFYIPWIHNSSRSASKHISVSNHWALSCHSSSSSAAECIQHEATDSNLWTKCRACQSQYDWDSLFTLQLRDRVTAQISVSARCSKLLLIKPLERLH